MDDYDLGFDALSLELANNVVLLVTALMLSIEKIKYEMGNVSLFLNTSSILCESLSVLNQQKHFLNCVDYR